MNLSSHKDNETVEPIQKLDIDSIPEEKKAYFVRRALNYALWSLQRPHRVKPEFLEKATKCVYILLKSVRNTRIEMNCLFVYWILHELLFNAREVDTVRIAAGIDNVKRIAAFFSIKPLVRFKHTAKGSDKHGVASSPASSI